MSTYDAVVTGGTVVLPGGRVQADIGIRDGRIAAIADSISPQDASEVIDAKGRLVVPGGVDAHFHLGIYRDMADDTRSETESSIAGGVTTIVSYFRTGTHYLGKSGPYREILPQALGAVTGNARVDFGFHLAPMVREQVAEISELAGKQGILSYKYYMFYRGLDLAGDSHDATSYTMSSEYDLAHLLEIMEAVSQANADRDDGARVSLSLHCENSDLIKLFMDRVRRAGTLTGLEAYSAARPPLTERLAIAEAGVLATATRCPVNFLHLSSADALDAASTLERDRPELDIRIETTLHHLALSYETYNDQLGKVNPPIRSERDRDAMWDGVRNGTVDWVVSDHACCGEELKSGDMWHALPGFGGSALIYSYLMTEGPRRGIPVERIVEIASTNPARAFGLAPRKGAITIGADADLAILDMNTPRKVTPALLHSAQTYTPFGGMELVGWPVRTILRGRTVFADGDPVGEPIGEFLHRPL
jgi:dihydropyrimidinase/allantoinase